MVARRLGLATPSAAAPAGAEHAVGARQTSPASLTIVVYESAALNESGPIDNLVMSAQRANFGSADVVVLGRGSQHLWKKTKSGEVPYGVKLQAIRAFLDTLPPSQLIFIMDGRDTIIQMPPGEIVRRFQSLVAAAGKDPWKTLLFSAESACCVAPMWRHPPGSFMNFSVPGAPPARMRHTGDPPPAGGIFWDKGVLQQWTDFFVGELRKANATTESFPYLNAGQIIGSVQNVAKLLNHVRFDITEDDQVLFSEAMWHASKGEGELSFVLDYEQKIVSSAGWRGPELCPFSPRPQHCTYRGERWRDGRRVFQDLVTGSVPAVIHTQNKFWTCYNSLVSGLLGKRGFMQQVSHSQLTTGAAATFRGGYHMLNVSLMTEFQQNCPTLDRYIGHGRQRQQQHNRQIQPLTMSPMRVYSEQDMQRARHRHAEQSFWMEFWNMHAGMIYEFSSTWNVSVVERTVAMAWELQGRPSFLQGELRRLPPHHVFAEEARTRLNLCDAVLASAAARERACECINITDAVIGKSSMLRLHAAVEKGLPKSFHDLEEANNQLGEHVKSLFQKHPEHQTEHDGGEVGNEARLDRLARPDAVLVGSDSCGAELLGDWLAGHPELAVPTRPVHHFSHLYRSTPASELSASALQGYSEMLMGARAGGRPKSNGSMVLEVSPSYWETHWFPSLPQMLASYAPKVKLVAVVCDPAQRALRQFQQDEGLAASESSCRNGSDPLQPMWQTRAKQLQKMLAEDGIHNFESLAGAIENANREGDDVPQLSRKCSSKSCHYQKYFLPGLYQKHMMRVLKEFPAEQLLVVDGAALAKGDPLPLAQKVLTFLGLEPKSFTQETLPRLGRIARGSPDPAVQRGLQKLQKLYNHPNEMLACSIKEDFPLRWGAVAGSHRSLQKTCDHLASEIPDVEAEDMGLRASVVRNLHRISRNR